MLVVNYLLYFGIHFVYIKKLLQKGEQEVPETVQEVPVQISRSFSMDIPIQDIQTEIIIRVGQPNKDFG